MSHGPSGSDPATNGVVEGREQCPESEQEDSMVAMVDPKIGLLGFAHPSENGPNKDILLGYLKSQYGWAETAASPKKIKLVYDQRGTSGWTPETNASYMVTNDNPDIFVASGS